MPAIAGIIFYKQLNICIWLLPTGSIQAEKPTVTIGAELLTSFSHGPSFLGVGGSVQLEIWIKWIEGLHGYKISLTQIYLPGLPKGFSNSIKTKIQHFTG